MTDIDALADDLLEAQVAWALGELSGPRVLAIVDEVVDDALDAAMLLRLDAVVLPDDLLLVLDTLLRRLPASSAVDGLVRDAADQVHRGPTEPVAPAELVDRDQVVAGVDAALAFRPLVEDALEGLTDSPLVGTLASRFVTRIVMEVLEANRSMTSRIPGLGSIVSLGTNAATKVVDVADRQVQALLGDQAGKGAALAVRRLNAVLVATLEDETFRDAILEVWDVQSATPLAGLRSQGVAREDVRTAAASLQAVVASVLASPAAADFLGTWVDTVFERHGEDSVGALLTDLGLSRDDVRDIARSVVPQLVAGARTWGMLEEAIRRRLAPFYASTELRAVLGAHLG